MDLAHLNWPALAAFFAVGVVLVTILRYLITLGVVMGELTKWRDEMKEWKGKADETLAVVRDRLNIPKPS